MKVLIVDQNREIAEHLTDISPIIYDNKEGGKRVSTKVETATTLEDAMRILECGEIDYIFFAGNRLEILDELERHKDEEWNTVYVLDGDKPERPICMYSDVATRDQSAKLKENKAGYLHIPKMEIAIALFERKLEDYFSSPTQ